MTVVYLILAHNNPKQLQRLVKNLQAANVFVFIHIDKKTDEKPFVELLQHFKNVFFCDKRISVNWAGFSIVEATVLLMESMLQQIEVPDYVHLLSGQDFPLRSPEQIENFLKRNYGHNFIEFEPFPITDWNFGGMDRIEYNWFIDNLGYKRANELIKYQKPKKINSRITTYGGSQWWSLTGECVVWLFEQCRKGNEIYDFFKYTLIPDEMLFQTMLIHSPFKETLINTNVRKIDRFNLGPFSHIWLNNDIEILKKTPKFFARKFDEKEDETVLDELETFILQPVVKKETPAISVVMSMRNSEKYIRECIESVLNQTFNDFEFIIVDDGSEDSSVEIVESFHDSRIKLIKNRHDFIDSLNKGMAVAKGEYIARMDSDDIMLPERLETQYDYMICNPQIDICGAWVECFGVTSDILKPPTYHDYIVSRLLFENTIINPTVFIKNESIRKNSLAYKNYYEEDYKFWVDCVEAGLNFVTIHKVLLKYRITKEQIDSSCNKEVMQSTNKIKLEYAQFVAESIVEKEDVYANLLDNLIVLTNNKRIDVSLFLYTLYNLNIKLMRK